jgi:S-adenosylmethionine synthetase
MQSSESVDLSNTFLFASESVGEGHPDKLCDLISDSIVDNNIRVDPDAICGMEAATRSGNVSLIINIFVYLFDRWSFLGKQVCPKMS